MLVNIRDVRICSQILSNDRFTADIGNGKVRRENRSGSDSFLGRNIRDRSHRHRLRHSVYTTISSVFTLQYSQTTDSGHSAIAGGLLYKSPIVDRVQRVDTAGADTVVQHRYVP